MQIHVTRKTASARRRPGNRAIRSLCLQGCFIALLILVVPAQGHTAMAPISFKQAAPQGFGDRQNSWAWSMQWWRGHLYVGTNRSYRCIRAAALNNAFPDSFPYPPSDRDVECTPDATDLPLQAEIWRWTPENDTWDRVYQAPNSFRIPGTQKFMARDIGYRGMTVFKEPDGTEALYVGSVSPRWLTYDVPPRILRSTDGLTFKPIPQEPGTFLGDFKLTSFRNLITYKERLYIQGGTALGDGVLLEAKKPAGGNNNFRDVTPAGRRVSAAYPFNGSLYIGTTDYTNGYAVLKTDATGNLPYTYTPVIEHGGYATTNVNHEILSMQVFKNQLYLGANGVPEPAELVKINRDDTWDVVVGDPRMTPSGWKAPLSGLKSGFGDTYNLHMWRMAVFDDELYVGTFDHRTNLRDDPNLPTTIRQNMGFDLYRSLDGISFFPITTTGFGDELSYGVRSLEATPFGLFLGSANDYFGLQIWRTKPPQRTPNRIFLPLVTTSSGSASVNRNAVVR